jgi:hypothetical protein
MSRHEREREIEKQEERAHAIRQTREYKEAVEKAKYDKNNTFNSDNVGELLDRTRGRYINR